MLIEITGPTGTGKTTLIRKIYNQVKYKNPDTVFIYENSIHTGIVPAFIQDSLKHGMITDIYLSPWLFFFILKYPRYFVYSIYIICFVYRDKISKTDIARGFLRKCGLFEFLKRKKYQDIHIFMDEGLLHNIQLLLVSPFIKIEESVIDNYIKLTPLSDKTILLRNKKELIIKRTYERQDFYPSTYNENEKKEYICKSVDMFNYVSNINKIRNGSLIIEDINNNVDLIMDYLKL